MFTTFDRYLLRRYVHTFLILFVSLYGLFVVIDGFTNIDAFQEGQTTASGTLRRMGEYYLFQSSIFFNLVGAMLSVIAVMVLFALLKKNAEISPILAAGIPTYRLLLPCGLGTLLVNGAVVANQELVIPGIAHRLQEPRGSKDDSGKHVDPITDYRTHIRIYGHRLYLADRRIETANFVLPVPDVVNELTTLAAEEAHFEQATSTRPAGWLLKGVAKPYATLPLTETGREIVLPQEDPTQLFVATDVTFDELYNRSRSYQYCSTAELIQRLRTPAVGSASLRGQILHLHSRLVAPIGNLLAIFVAVPLVMRRESRSLIGNMALCTVVLCCLQGAAQLSFYLCKASLISPDLAAWSPAILAGSLAGWLTGIVQT